jgi:Tol biopolymer transport system component
MKLRAGLFALCCSTAVPAMERVSISSEGGQGNNFSVMSAISADGRQVAFLSMASNLVAGDTNRNFDIFVRDRRSGVTRRVSLAADGAEAQGSSAEPAFAADGKSLAFSSSARNLVDGDSLPFQDVFTVTLSDGRVERVSVDAAGQPALGDSRLASVSADGRHVAFVSRAANLAAGDDNGENDIFVRDRNHHRTARISNGLGGAAADGASTQASISRDGQIVAFRSSATNLVPGDTNYGDDIFVYVRKTGRITRIAGPAAQPNGDSLEPALAGDGRFVAFVSYADNLVPHDDNQREDVFVYDRRSGRIARASESAQGAAGNGSSGQPTITPDGRFVAFLSDADNLVDGDTNRRKDIFVKDMRTRRILRVSMAADGSQGDGDCFQPSISADGVTVAFRSNAGNLVPADSNFTDDVFVTTVVWPRR